MQAILSIGTPRRQGEHFHDTAQEQQPMNVARRITEHDFIAEGEKTTYTTTFEKLILIVLDQEAHDRTRNYWYLIQSCNTAHTAFTTRDELVTWADERGLTLPDEVPEPGEHSVHPIKGFYRRASHTSYAMLDMAGRRTIIWDNGRKTLAIITDEAGIRTVHHLNCNMLYRPCFDEQPLHLV